MTTTATKNEFIFEDSEIPDLVLEAIIGFVAEMTPMERWGDIRSVSKRWNRISKPVLKEAFERAWPKFILPRAEDDHLLEFTKNRGRVEMKGDDDNYRWALVQPLPLFEVAESKKPIRVKFTLSEPRGVYVGAFIVHSRESALFGKEIAGNPEDSHLAPEPGADLGFVILGCYSGQIIVRQASSRTGENEFHGHGYLGDNHIAVYEVEYAPGGMVSFFVNKPKKDCSLHGEPRQLDEKEIIEKHGTSALLVFTVGIANSTWTATVTR